MIYFIVLAAQLSWVNFDLGVLAELPSRFCLIPISVDIIGQIYVVEQPDQVHDQMNRGPVPSSILTNLYILRSRYCFHGPCPPRPPSLLPATRGNLWSEHLCISVPSLTTCACLHAAPSPIPLPCRRRRRCRMPAVAFRVRSNPIYRFSGSAATRRRRRRRHSSLLMMGLISRHPIH